MGAGKDHRRDTPRPELGENVIIQFVPLIKDPLDDFDIGTKTSKPAELIPSQIVVRIIVKPTKGNVINIYPVKRLNSNG